MLLEVRFRRDLKCELGATRLVALLELDRELADPGRQQCAVLLARGDHQPGDLREMLDLLFEIGGLEGGVADAPAP